MGVNAVDQGRSTAPGKVAPALTDRVGVLALLMPALGYAAAFLYRRGEARFYGLPPELVTLDLKDVVVGGSWCRNCDHRGRRGHQLRG